MATAVETKKRITDKANPEVAEFFGNLYAFNNGLKLYHWHVTGKGSYAQHMALDQALEALTGHLDRIVETTYAIMGDQGIVIPETRTPDNIVQYATDFYNQIEYQRSLFEEDFINSILDDFQEAIQQLLYRLKRLE
ncbi:MAG: DUF5856 family protein [Bacteroides sp.]|nr:DUF5856 family protein [Bacteroides sp.]